LNTPFGDLLSLTLLAPVHPENHIPLCISARVPILEQIRRENDHLCINRHSN
jgi:hypothetical protein